MRTRTRRVLLAVFLVVFVISCTMLIRSHLQYTREREANDYLADMMHAAEQDTPGQESAVLPVETSEVSESEEPFGNALETNVPAPEVTPQIMLSKFSGLYEINSNLAGWLFIEDTTIDYPVVYTAFSQNHYIHLAFNGIYAASGTLFLGVPWNADSNHAIIYGHHMNDGSMFGNLNRYAKEVYGLEHNIIRFDTLYEECDYELVAAFYSKIYGENEEGVFRYYDYADLSDPEDFAYYVREAKAAALYETGVEPEYGDRLLTLSTCEYHTSNGRFVVVACHKAEAD